MGVQGGLRLGVLGGGCSGLSYQFKFDTKPRPTDKVFEFDGVKIFVDPEEHGLSERHDARLEGLADSVRLRVRKSEREEKLRLRNVFLGVTGLFRAARRPAQSQPFPGRPCRSAYYELSRQLHPDRFMQQARSRAAARAGYVVGL